MTLSTTSLQIFALISIVASANILGGILQNNFLDSKSEDIILDGLKEMVRGHLVYKEEEFADIVIATLGNDAGIIGAAILGQ